MHLHKYIQFHYWDVGIKPENKAYIFVAVLNMTSADVSGFKNKYFEIPTKSMLG